MMAFARNVIREIVIPDSVRYIDAEAFYSCNNLDTKFLSSQPERTVAFPKITYDGNTVSVCSLSLS